MPSWFLLHDWQMRSVHSLFCGFVGFEFFFDFLHIFWVFFSNMIFFRSWFVTQPFPFLPMATSPALAQLGKALPPLQPGLCGTGISAVVGAGSGVSDHSLGGGGVTYLFPGSPCPLSRTVGCSVFWLLWFPKFINFRCLTPKTTDILSWMSSRKNVRKHLVFISFQCIEYYVNFVVLYVFFWIFVKICDNKSQIPKNRITHHFEKQIEMCLSDFFHLS